MAERTIFFSALDGGLQNVLLMSLDFIVRRFLLSREFSITGGHRLRLSQALG